MKHAERKNSPHPAPPENPRRQRYRLLFRGIVVGGALLRLLRLPAALEYDEIWTLENYATGSLRHIFTDLALPNNHALNSLCVKLTASEGFVQSIRLIPWLAGVLSIPLAGLIALRLWKNRQAALWSMFFLATLPMAIDYSQQARGYSLQLFLLLLFTFGLLILRSRPRCGAAAVIGGSVGAILTLPTSALYLGAIGGYAAWRNRNHPAALKKGAPALLTAGALCLGWMLLNYNQYRQNSIWGQPIHSTAELLSYLAGILQSCIPTLLLILVAAGALFRLRGVALAAWLALFALASALLANAAPARTFLPLAGAAAILAGGAAALLLLRAARRSRLAGAGRAIALLLILIPLLYTVRNERLSRPDWYGIHETVKQLPPEILAIFTAGDSNPVSWNNGDESAADYIMRLSVLPPPDKSRKLLMLTANNAVNGMTPTGSEIEIPVAAQGIPLELCGLKARIFGLEATDSPAPGDTLIAVVRPTAAERALRITRPLLRNGDWIILNPWISQTFTNEKGTFAYGSYAIHLTGDEEIDWAGFLDEPAGATALFRVVSVENPE